MEPHHSLTIQFVADKLGVARIIFSFRHGPLERLEVGVVDLRIAQWLRLVQRQEGCASRYLNILFTVLSYRFLFTQPNGSVFEGREDSGRAAREWW